MRSLVMMQIRDDRDDEHTAPAEDHLPPDTITLELICMAASFSVF